MSKRINNEDRSAFMYFFATENGLTIQFKRSDSNTLHEKRLGFDRGMLFLQIKKAMEGLLNVADASIWSELRDPLGAPRQGEHKLELMNCLEQVISVGATLHREFSRDKGFDYMLKKIEELPDGSRIQINTNCAFLPWEILYPLNYYQERNEKTEANFRPELLWGNRFLIEVLHGEMNTEYLPPYAEHRNAKPYLSLNLNPTIDEEFEGEYKPLVAHKEFYDRYLSKKRRGKIWTEGAKVKANLQSDKNKETVIYLYCHGSNEDPYTDNQEEQLQLDAKTFISPQLLDNDHNFLHGPIVFLNSCRSASYSPLSFSNFLTVFKGRRSLGLVATSFTMPVSFAAAFGKELLERYLDGEPIGEALFRIRRDLLKKNNPLGMFYALQCPMHVRAPK